MDMAHEEKALEGCRREEYAAWIDLHIRRERQWGQVCTALMRQDPTELTAVMFDGVDKLQHLCWRFIAAENGAAAGFAGGVDDAVADYADAHAEGLHFATLAAAAFGFDRASDQVGTALRLQDDVAAGRAVGADAAAGAIASVAGRR